MSTAAPRKLITAEELEVLPDDGMRYELSRGELICMSPSSTWPGIVAANILFFLGSFVHQQRLGRCGTADSGFRLASDPDTVRAPDVWFIRAERIPTPRPSRGFWAVAPDLAVEVLSPSDRWTDVLRKVSEYLAAGTRLVWVIDPEGRFARVFRADRAPLSVSEDGSLDGEDVIPGFLLPLRNVLE